MNALSLRSTKLLKATRKSMYISPFFFGVCGLFFLLEGLGQENNFNFVSYVGAMFVVLALSTLVVNVRAYGGSVQNDS